MTTLRQGFAGEVTAVPALRARTARWIAQRALSRAGVRAGFPEDRSDDRGRGAESELLIIRPEDLFARLARHPKIGLGEAYMAGDWAPAPGADLGVLLTRFATRFTTLVPRPLTWLRGLVDRPLPQHQRNTREGARANIAAHYDLGNEFFAGFLDSSMTYSSALFDEEIPFSEQRLEDAQRRKVERILDVAGVGAGTRLLEIGTGWGSVALAAAARGARVTTITLSAEQQRLAAERVAAAGLSELVTVRLLDYRDVRGSYNAIISVEMIEAVGEDYWPAYFSTLAERLAPGGRIALQAIVMDHGRMRATRNSYGWVQKYIFPGGLIPSIRAIEQTCRTHTDLQLTDVHHFGPHYAETLRRWRRSFTDSWPAIASARFDEVFRRMWEYYLAYCEAGFASGYLDVVQLGLSREPA